MVSARILVVEDEVIVATNIQNRLKKLGHDVPAIASSGEEAVKKAAEMHPDLVLMDIRLKGDMDGVEAAEQIRAASNIPVLYLTAYANHRILERAKTTEPYAYIVKPFQERELCASIELALYKHKRESKLRKSKDWLATTLKSMGDAVITSDAKGLVTFMNPAAEVLTGWRQKDAFGKELLVVFYIIDKEGATPSKNPLTRAMGESRVVDLATHYLLVAREGGKVPIGGTAAPIRDDKKGIIGLVLVFRNITQHKPTEKALRASAEKYRLAVEKARLRGKMPVILTEEEMKQLKRQTQLEEKYYRKELKKRKGEGSRRLKRIENKIFNARRNRSIMALFYSTGIRLAELVELNLTDIDLKERQVKMPIKKGGDRHGFFSGETARALKVYIKARKARGNAQDEALFISKTGERVKGRDVHRIISSCAKGAGVNKKVSPHTLRHSIAIHLLDRGMDFGDLQAFLRHASISSTRIYTYEVSNRRLKEKLSCYHPDHP